jgi:hypothetical protein
VVTDRATVQKIINEVADQEAVANKKLDQGGGAIVVFVDPERRRALARTIVRGTTPLNHLVRFFSQAEDQARARQEIVVGNPTLVIGVAGLPNSNLLAKRVARSLLSGHAV